MSESGKQAGNSTQPAVRHWLRFSLRTFLIASLVLALGLAWMGNILVRVRHQRAIVVRIEATGGLVRYDYEWDTEIVGGRSGRPSPPGPWIVRRLIGNDAFANVAAVQFNHNAQISDQDLESLTRLPKLRWVVVNTPTISDAGVVQLSRIQNLEHLSMPIVAGSDLHPLNNAKCLRELSIGGEHVTGRFIADVDQLQSLTSLQLFRSSVTSSDLAPAARLPKLESLNLLASKSIGDDGLDVLSHFKKLKSLDLGLTSVTDKGLAEVGRLTQLESLELRGCSITDAGVAHVSELKELSKLNVSHTPIDDAATASICELKQLRFLDVSYTALTDEGLSKLLSLPNLKHLRFGPGISAAGASAARKQLPNCRIDWEKPTGGLAPIPKSSESGNSGQ